MMHGVNSLMIRVLGEGGVGTRDLAMTGEDNGGQRCRVHGIPGVEWVHVAIFDGADCLFRCELAVQGEESVDLRLYPQADGSWRLDAGNRQVLVLPARAADPPPPIPLPMADPAGGEGGCWQVVLVLDGTVRQFRRDHMGVWRADPVLGDAEAWPPIAEWLSRLVTELAQSDQSLRWSMLAFADEAVPGVVAEGLRPAYKLMVPRPDSRLRLHSFAPDAFASTLDRLGSAPSSGGDFVDALADALAACRRLDWRPGRKLVVIVGDSPGYSVLHPVECTGNARARCLDVDSESLALHAMGVEIVTLYLAPPAGLIADLEPRARRLIADAEQQYLRLASIPDYAGRLGDLDADALAGLLLARDFPIGRGSSLGMPGEPDL